MNGAFSISVPTFLPTWLFRLLLMTINIRIPIVPTIHSDLEYYYIHTLVALSNLEAIMQVTTMGLVIQGAMDSARRLDWIPSHAVTNLPPFLLSIVSWYLSPKLKKAATALADVSFKLTVFSQQVQRSVEAELIDPRLDIRDMLEKLKCETLAECRSLKASFGRCEEMPNVKHKLLLQVQTLLNLMDEICDTVSELQWALAEHDASVGKRMGGFTASSAEELDAMLQRIYAEA